MNSAEEADRCDWQTEPEEVSIDWTSRFVFSQSDCWWAESPDETGEHLHSKEEGKCSELHRKPNRAGSQLGGGVPVGYGVRVGRGGCWDPGLFHRRNLETPESKSEAATRSLKVFFLYFFKANSTFLVFGKWSLSIFNPYLLSFSCLIFFLWRELLPWTDR